MSEKEGNGWGWGMRLSRPSWGHYNFSRKVPAKAFGKAGTQADPTLRSQ